MRLAGSGKRLILYSLLMQYTGDPVHPDWQVAAQRAIAEAAGANVIDGELPEAVHRQLAQALLVSVWHCGAYFLVSPKDWPDLLPELVLGAVRSAPLINQDDLMHHLRTTGANDAQPGRDQ